MFKKLLLTTAFSLALLPVAGAANAADLGGDCCADLEERVATLEATTARKGNRKVSLTVSGWVNQAILLWDDGSDSDLYVLGDSTDLASNVNFAGSARINHDWSAGYRINVFFDAGNTLLADQLTDEGRGTPATDGISVQQSNLWIKSESLGKVTIGLQSSAADNAALGQDSSGTLFPANAVTFDGPGFILRPKGGTGLANTVATSNIGAGRWGSLLHCNGNGAGTASDCHGARTNAVRYDSPTIAGFMASLSWGEDDKYESTLSYKTKWQDWAFNAAVSYSRNEGDGLVTASGADIDSDLFQVGGTLKHLPSNLWIHGYYHTEDTENASISDGTSLYLKAGWSPKLNSLGTTHFWFEYGQVKDKHGFYENGTASTCAAFEGTGGNLDTACTGVGDIVNITGSEVTRLGAGIQQQIDAAAMQIYAKWRMMEAEVDYNGNGLSGTEEFEDLHLFMAGGVIFF